jgi:hypothetical protein
MSKISLSGNASGTGTFTIASPNSNTDRTLTLPDNTGTLVTTGSTAGVSQAMLAAGVAGNGPAFSAYASGTQTGLTNNAYTKVLFDTEEFDTNSNFASSRFTPTVAGYYQINGAVTSPVTTSTQGLTTVIHKNGSLYKTGAASKASGSMYPCSLVGSIVYLNGSTDYVEIYAYGDMGAAWTTTGSIYFTYFNGALIRSAI